MSTPSDDPGNTDLLEQVRAEHEAEIRLLQDRHRAAIHQVRGSIRYQLGDLILSLRKPRAWLTLPRRLRTIVVEARRLRHQAAAPPMPVAPDDARDGRPVLSIFDEFTHDCLAPELSLQPADRKAWADQLDRCDLVLAETAWRGNAATWSYAFNHFEPGNDLDRLLAAARERGIPSAIWNKEDPVSYDLFLPSARAFDVVFTTDEDMVPSYRRDLGHSRVATMMFAAQPRLHNPIGRSPAASASVCFAGAWRGHRYPDRVAALATLLDAADAVGDLRIFDRQPSDHTTGEGFPPRFHPRIQGTLPYPAMVEEYRNHAAFINVNTVTTSPTMMSRRVFEILACRTPVVSTPSPAIDTHLGDVVLTPTGASEAEATIGALVTDPDHRDRVGQRGFRAVHTRHNYQHRIAEAFDVMGLPGFDAPSEPVVDVICVTNRPHELSNVIANVRRQSYGGLRFTLVTNSDGFDEDEVERAVAPIAGASVLRLPEHLTIGQCMNAAIDATDGEFFAKIDDDDVYGEHYLSDMILATRFTDAAVYGKATFHAHTEGRDETVVRHEGHEYTYTSQVMGGTLLVRRRDVGGIRFEDRPTGADTAFLAACRDAGLRIFSTDRFNYLMVRRGDPGDHTWRISEEDFLRNTRSLGSGRRDDLVLI
ncbi:MAG: glycosyltransferase [Actinomycetota bacterium]